MKESVVVANGPIDELVRWADGPPGEYRYWLISMGADGGFRVRISYRDTRSSAFEYTSVERAGGTVAEAIRLTLEEFRRRAG